MSKVWRKLNRVGKKASKYKFTTHSHILKILCNSKWQPNKICITWTRRGRKISSKFSEWEPSLQNPYQGTVYWEKSTDYIEFDISLYRGINDDSFEDKDWSILIESEEANGKRRLLATAKLNMNDYASIDPLFQTDIKDMSLKLTSNKIVSATISFSLMCQFIKEGKATDEDMMSIASFMSAVSTSNPYLNSNCMFKNLDTKPNNNNNNNNRLSKNINLDFDMNPGKKLLESNSDFLADKNENEQDDIEYYLKLKNSYSNDDFNDISKNFGNQVQQVTGNFKNDFLETLNKNSLDKPKSVETFKKMEPSKKSTPNKSNSSTVIKTRTLSNNKENNGDQPNPFLEKNDQTDLSNPFIDESEPKNDSHPFLSPTLTNSIEKDMSNPFSNIDPPRPKEKCQAPIRQKLADTFSDSVDSSKSMTSTSLDTTDTSRELLDWCGNIITTYKATAYMPGNKHFENLDIKDFTSSWKSGLAFCAIFYHYRPNLIDLKVLSESDTKKNLKQAFKASDSEKIGRVVDYSDILNKENLDQLLIMTFLFQLRDHFEQKETKVQALQSPTKNKSNFLTPLKKLDRKLSVMMLKKEKTKNTSTPIKENTKDFTISNQSRNPFESDPDEMEENLSSEKNSDGLIKIKSNGEIENLSNETSSAYQAKHEIDNISTPRVTPTTSKAQRKTKSPQKDILSNKSEDLVNKANKLLEKNSNDSSKSEDLTEKVKDIIKQRRKSSMKSKSKEKSIDKGDHSIIGTEYVNQEIINFKNEQKELDEHADFLEKKLRSIMNSSKKGKKNDKEKDLEDRLLKEWFLLVNRKNALFIRQQELEKIQNEKNLEIRYELLSDKLRDLIHITEFEKTEEQKTIESILLNELISNVMERNELVIQMDEENKLLNEGEIIDEFIQNKQSFQGSGDEKQCLIQ